MTRLPLLLLGLATILSASLAAQEEPPIDPSDPTRLPETVVEADQAPVTEPPPELPPTPAPPPPQPGGFFVSPPVEGYFPDSSTSATRLDTPIMELPFSLQTVPEQLLEDRYILSGDRALETVPGAFSTAPGSGGDTRRASIRGFRPGSLYRDGVRQQWRGANDPQNWERIEVLKGPAAMFFGAGEIGGIINFITKRPHGDRFTEARQVLGTWDQTRTTLDDSGRIGGEDSNVWYRFNAAYENFDNFRTWGGENPNNEYIHLAPVVTWVLDDNTTFTVEYNYGFIHEQFDPGTVLFADGSTPMIPRDRRLDSDLQRFNRVEVNLFSTEFYTALFDNEDLILRHKFLNANENLDITQVNLRSLDETPGPTFGDLTRRSQLRYENVRRYYNYVDLAGRTEINGKRVDAVIGAYSEHRFGDNTQAVTPEYTNFNIFNPVYDNAATNFGNTSFSINNSENYAIYGNTQVQVHRDWFVLLGGRVDFAEVTSVPTGRAGLLYQPVEYFSVYGSYAQGFNVNDELDVNGNLLDSESSEQWEVGTKVLVTDRLLATVAAWDIVRENLPTDDPLNPGFSILLGEMRSKGVEFGMTGQMTDRWSTVLAYSYIDARITDDQDPDLIGNRLNNVPYTGGSAWLAYNAPLDRCGQKTIGGGLGAFAVGFRQGDLDNSFILPGYTRYDLGLWYRTPRYWCQANIQNLFDKDYFEAANSRLAVYYAPPVSLTMQAGVRW